jgi:hypothetical protein
MSSLAMQTISLTLGALQLLLSSSLALFVSSVGMAIVQRYLASVLSAALSLNQAVQWSAVDILSFTVRQGLTNPMEVDDHTYTALTKTLIVNFSSSLQS